MCLFAYMFARVPLHGCWHMRRKLAKSLNSSIKMKNFVDKYAMLHMCKALRTCA